MGRKKTRKADKNRQREGERERGGRRSKPECQDQYNNVE
jgi:hypothetical protein